MCDFIGHSRSEAPFSKDCRTHELFFRLHTSFIDKEVKLLKLM